MQYPIPIVIDKTARDIEEFIVKLASQRNMGADLLELSMIKALDSIRVKKLQDYAESYIALMNETDKHKEEKNAENN